MASKNVAVIEPDEEPQSSAIDAMPKLVLAVGRGKPARAPSFDGQQNVRLNVALNPSSRMPTGQMQP
jgi:hypothetical protein